MPPAAAPACSTCGTCWRCCCRRRRRIDDLVPDLGFLGDDLPSLQAKLKEVGGQPVGPLARPDLPAAEAGHAGRRGAAAFSTAIAPPCPSSTRTTAWSAFSPTGTRSPPSRTRNDRGVRERRLVRLGPVVGIDDDPDRHLRRDHDRAGQPRHRRAARRRPDDPDRRHHPGAGDRRRGFQHPGAAHRHDAAGRHRPQERHVPVPRDLVGQGGQGPALGHPRPALAGDGARLGPARQRHHRPADRAGHARHHRAAEGAALPLPVHGDPRLQHRRHRHPHRRSPQHHHRLGRRPVVQRLRGQPGAGDRRRPGGAAAGQSI